VNADLIFLYNVVKDKIEDIDEVTEGGYNNEHENRTTLLVSEQCLLAHAAIIVRK
jgi:glutathionyl-hydroquinone reductase